MAGRRNTKPAESSQPDDTPRDSLRFPPPFVSSLGRRLELDEPLSARLAARVWPGREKPFDKSGVYRFWEKGSGGHLLRYTHVPGTGRVTTWRWILEFIATVAGSRKAACDPRNPAPRRKRSLLRQAFEQPRADP